MDTCLLLRSLGCSEERNRTFYVTKSLGMNQPNQFRAFLLTNNGVELLDVYFETGAVLTGSARFVREAQEKAEALERKHSIEKKRLDLEERRQLLNTRIAAMKSEFEAEEKELQRLIDQSILREDTLEKVNDEIARIRR
ncbi:MAG: hypothetical protein ACP5U1_07340 [Desulfomonilaceae bacterium]